MASSTNEYSDVKQCKVSCMQIKDWHDLIENNFKYYLHYYVFCAVLTLLQWRDR